MAALQGSDIAVAWTRTTVNSLWLGLLIWLNTRYEWGVDFTSPWVILGIGVTSGIVWRVSELLSKIPYLGYVLFGINRSPSYENPPPTFPATPEDAELHGADRGAINTGDVLTLLVIILVVIVIVKLV